MRQMLAVLIPTLNEESNLLDCIESIGSLANELVIIDSFSSDATVKIAEAAGAIVLQRKFDDYAHQKNWALDQLKSDWILIVDADERLTPALRNEISTVLDSPTSSDGYLVPRDAYFAGRKVRAWSGGTALRLFRRQKGRYAEDTPVHERLILNGTIGRLRAPMEHYTFRSLAQYLPKVDQFTTLAADDLYRKGRRSSLASLLFLPAVHFLKMYIAKGGFLDGAAGITIAWLSARSTYLKYAKLRELQRRGR